MSRYTIKVNDDLGLLDAALERRIEAIADAVCREIAGVIEWQGVLDLEVRVLPHDALDFSDADGLLPSLGSISFDGSGFINQTLREALTGIDSRPAAPDIGCFMYLGKDGIPRNYGSPLWFDPNPHPGSEVSVPEGQHDFYGILMHEIFHGLGIDGRTKEWAALVQMLDDGFLYFVGDKTRELLGTPLPLSRSEPDGTLPDHYGNLENPRSKVFSGLMYEYGHYDGGRLEFGQLDLAILEDLGYRIRRDSVPTPSDSGPAGSAAETDAQGTAVDVYEAYLAYFGRPPDLVGLRAFAGVNDTAIVAVFGNSAESAELFQATTLEQRVDSIYLNLFGRNAETAGRMYWVGELDSGRITLGAVALAVLDAAINQDALAVRAKIEVMQAFTEELSRAMAPDDAYTGLAAAGIAREFLKTVRGDTHEQIEAARLVALRDIDELVEQVFAASRVNLGHESDGEVTSIALVGTPISPTPTGF